MVGQAGDHAVAGRRAVPPARAHDAVGRGTEDRRRLREDAGKQVLSDLVDDELLVQEAARDTSIKVTDKEVIDAVAAAIKNIRSRYTTEPEFKAELHKAGFTPASTSTAGSWPNSRGGTCRRTG